MLFIIFPIFGVVILAVIAFLYRDL